MNKIGQCHICGKNNVKLTYEHIPPRVAFNKKCAKLVSGEDIILSDNNPWDFTGLKYEHRQRGMGLHSLCGDCNSKMGRWYAPAYIHVAKCINAVHYKLKMEPNNYYEFIIKEMKPLNFIKQIISMFCSVEQIDAFSNDEQIRGFLLDPQNNTFDREKYRIYIHLATEGISKLCGKTFAIRGSGIIDVISEIVSYPLGLTLQYNPNSTNHGLDITEFTNYKYDEICEVKFVLPNKRSNSILPGDYRSEEEILVCRKMNKKYQGEGV